MILPRRDVRYGDGAILRTPRVVADLGAARVLLVCGRRSFEACGAARMLPDLERVAQVRRWSEFAPNTDVTDLRRGLAVAEEFRPDLVLGVGGGSAMDMAKLLCVFRGVTDPDALHQAIRSGEPIVGRGPRMVLAPTTSGSGSEATHFAVVYIGDEKHSVAGPVLRPHVVVLDPGLTLSGSRYQRATSGIDAVAQAIESLWAVGATDLSRSWARHALRLLLPAIETYVNEPAQRAARAMAIGSHLAGRAIDISKTTAPHALSYAITKRYGVSHGHAVALTLGAFIEAHRRSTPERLRVCAASHAAVMDEITTRLPGDDGPGQRPWSVLLRRLGLEPDLLAAGVPQGHERATVATAVNQERLSNNPVAFTSAELVEMLSAAA